ncbi:MAG: hypothetical protein IAF94_24090 [Pirellulaceae bacterium]|nr:hypothetical protein [Pirellulaceae bacterium]
MSNLFFETEKQEFASRVPRFVVALRAWECECKRRTVHRHLDPFAGGRASSETTGFQTVNVMPHSQLYAMIVHFGPEAPSASSWGTRVKSSLPHMGQVGMRSGMGAFCTPLEFW